MKTKAKLQIYTASNYSFIPTITIGNAEYYVCCDRTEIKTGRIRNLTKWSPSGRTLHEAIVRSTENGEYYTKVVSGYITISIADITRDKLRGESSVTVVSKAAGYLASKLGWNFPQTLSL